jgi:hypothetical protein
MGEEMKADRDGRAAALGFGDDDRGMEWMARPW